jgi:hypothetical protein
MAGIDVLVVSSGRLAILRAHALRRCCCHTVLDLDTASTLNGIHDEGGKGRARHSLTVTDRPRLVEATGCLQC